MCAVISHDFNLQFLNNLQFEICNFIVSVWWAYLCMIFTICVSFLVRYLFRFLPIFSGVVLEIFDVQILYQICGLQDVSQFVACLLTFWIKSFRVQISKCIKSTILLFSFFSFVDWLIVSCVKTQVITYKPSPRSCRFSSKFISVIL